jgi:ribonuclease D
VSKNYPFKQIYRINSTPVYWIDTRDQTEIILEIFQEKGISRLAIDQERAPYYKYYYQTPCLVQLAIEECIFFIDLIQNKEILKSLASILKNPKIEKIFFDAPWDLYFFKKSHNISIEGVKDIQICSSLLYPNIGTASLIKLVKDEFNIDIKKPKKQQKSDWTKRPLSTKQIHYAGHEIIWFLPVYKVLLEKMKNNGLNSFFDYGNTRLEVDIPNLDYNPKQVLKIKGANSLSNQEIHRLIQLGILRDKIAKKRNRPAFFILSNQQLLDLAKDGYTLDSIRSPNQKFSKVEKQNFNQVLKENYPDSPLLDTSDNFSDYPTLKQHLLTWRFSASKHFKLPKRFIISKSEISNLDDSCFNNQESLLKVLWFTHRKDQLCTNLTNDLITFLQASSEN